MPQSICVLGGYTFAANAPSQKNPSPKSVGYVPTLGGGYNTVYPVYQQDRIIELDWPTLSWATYTALEAKKNVLGNQSFTDWTGTAYTVIVLDLTYDTILKGGLDALTGVKMTLRVVSQP